MGPRTDFPSPTEGATCHIWKGKEVSWHVFGEKRDFIDLCSELLKGMAKISEQQVTKSFFSTWRN